MRKDQHIQLALSCKTKSSLEDIKLKYYSILDISLDDIDYKTSFCGMDFETPIYINAMTGGSEKADEINRRLEYISNKLNIFMFSGSYSPNLKGQNSYYPKGLGANIGADKDVSDMEKVVKETNCKILQVHVNPIQELIMLEGDRSFSYTLNIQNALKNIKVPIIIKETGFGMSKESIEKLINMGVKCIDISGKGGTDFSYIEDKRAGKNREYFYTLGYTTKESLLNAMEYMEKVEILASGGISTPLDVVKALSMGAKACGMSGYILKLLSKHTDEEVIEILEEFLIDIKKIMCITNSKNLKELVNKWEV